MFRIGKRFENKAGESKSKLKKKSSSFVSPNIILLTISQIEARTILSYRSCTSVTK